MPRAPRVQRLERLLLITGHSRRLRNRSDLTAEERCGGALSLDLLAIRRSTAGLGLIAGELHGLHLEVLALRVLFECDSAEASRGVRVGVRGDEPAGCRRAARADEQSMLARAMSVGELRRVLAVEYRLRIA